MKVLLVLALSLVTCKAFILSSCSTDTDCGADGCCVKSFFSSRCSHRLPSLSRCPLQATTHSSCSTMCATGLQCIDESSLDIAIEPGYNTGSYGRCALPSSGAPATKVVSSAPSTGMAV
ncbi:uncharacterized protein LOC124119728 [Haliotis rufescens]|uniref:uncharacterized protein LOC124119728 n=1 Tax=Haliotis rufescens TaxID=6454 RepID=UPI001EB08CFB|nr:uncharacterized protein LOC124119728 [Haliotis rufescens]